jgi:uncharacterized protein with GYD domain
LSEKDFQQQVLERLSAIETNGQYFSEGLKIIREHGERITAAEASSSSAHKRIDGIYLTAGMFGAVAGWVADFVGKWSRGH